MCSCNTNSLSLSKVMLCTYSSLSNSIQACATNGALRFASALMGEEEISATCISYFFSFVFFCLLKRCSSRLNLRMLKIGIVQHLPVQFGRQHDWWGKFYHFGGWTK